MTAPWDQFTKDERLHTLSALVPEAREPFARLLEQAKIWNMGPAIVSARRTCDEETHLAASNMKDKTRSWHVLGRAVDVELRGKVRDYKKLGEWWEDQGGTWGGIWTSLYPQAPGVPGMSGDVMHFQWTHGAEAVPRDIWDPSLPCDEKVNDYMAREWNTEPGRTTVAKPAKARPGLELLLLLAPSLIPILASSWPKRHHLA